MNITYYVHDLEFPLREGVRKQAWWLAQAMKKHGHNVNIISTSRRRGTRIIENIPITYGNPLSISRVKTDILHYISHPSPLILPCLLRASARKQVMTMFDGNLNGFWKRPWAQLLRIMVQKRISTITIQTEYQHSLLKKSIACSAIKIPPLIPHMKRTCRRNPYPTLLFMSHFHPNKGIDETLTAYSNIKKRVPKIRLTAADSAITNHPQGLRKIQHQRDIALHGIVNPQKELSRAWVYLYPIRSAQETFSVPLSIIEAIQVGTPWISCNVGGLSEYFEDDFLIPPRSPAALSNKIIELIKKPKIGKLKKRIDNKQVIKQFVDIYES